MPKAQAVAMTFVLFISTLFSAQQPSSAQQVAPSLTLHDLKGAQHTLEEYRGKPVLLNFWATWCVPCAAEMPLLNEMQKQYQEAPG